MPFQYNVVASDAAAVVMRSDRTRTKNSPHFTKSTKKKTRTMDRKDETAQVGIVNDTACRTTSQNNQRVGSVLVSPSPPSSTRRRR